MLAQDLGKILCLFLLHMVKFTYHTYGDDKMENNCPICGKKIGKLNKAKIKDDEIVCTDCMAAISFKEQVKRGNGDFPLEEIRQRVEAKTAEKESESTTKAESTDNSRTEPRKSKKKNGLIWMVVAICILGIIGSLNNDDDESEADSNNNEEVEEEHSALGEVELTGETEILFTNFTVEIKEAEIEEKEGLNFLDLEILYTNDSFTEDTAFMAAVPIFNVYQDDEELTETSSVMTDTSSNYYYKNATGIWAPIEFEFELNNLEDNIILSFTSLDYGDPETYTIELN